MRNPILNLKSLIFNLSSSIFNLKSLILNLQSLIFYLSVLSAICPAQLVQQEWVARYPGPSNDLYGPFLALDKNGNSYIAGTHVINDSINILCVKYNTVGVLQWATLYRYPGEGYFAPTGLDLDTFGNAYVTSIYGLNTFSPLNCLLVKFNNLNGSVIWASKYVSQFRSNPLDIKIDRLNNIYVAGTSDSAHLLIKYNINGDSVWVRKYNLPGSMEVAYACTIDDSLNVIITGERKGCLNFPPWGCPYDTVLTAKYSSDGALRWIRTYRYNNDIVHEGRKITTDQNGSVYIGGVTRVSGYGVYLTVKYDRNGVWQWGKIYDASGSGDNTLEGISFDNFQNFLYVTGRAVVNGMGVAATIKYSSLTGDSIWVRTDVGFYNRGGARNINLDLSGNVYITGETYNFPSYVPYDILTKKYSIEGNQIWQISYNGPFDGLDWGLELKLDNSNNVYVLGSSQSSSQVRDYVIIKYSQLSIIQTTHNKVPASYWLSQNYPNPFNSTTKIRFLIPKRSFVQILVYDVLSRLKELLVNENINPSEYLVTLDGSNYPSGVYFYQMIANGKIIDTKKFIVAK